MKLDLTDDERAIQARWRAFADRELVPLAAAWDRDATYPREAVARAAQLGLLGLTTPAAWGGSGASAFVYGLAMEEVSRACAGVGVIVGVNKLFCDTVLRYGTDAQRRDFVVPCAREGLGCFALTEPSTGSDAAAIRTTAQLRGDAYVLQGGKCFISNAPQARAAIVFAVTAPGEGHRGISALLVPMDAPGITLGRHDDKVGVRASTSCQLFLDECRVPRRNLLGAEGDGFKIAMSALDGGRIAIAVQAVGIARAAFEASLALARSRQGAGRLGQSAAFSLADMATRIDAARLLAWRAARLRDEGQPFTAEASMAKLYASEMAERVTSRALQLLGDAGGLAGGDVERWWRDARVTQIYEGTSEIQRLVIAAAVLR